MITCNHCGFGFHQVCPTDGCPFMAAAEAERLDDAKHLEPEENTSAGFEQALKTERD